VLREPAEQEPLAPFDSTAPNFASRRKQDIGRLRD
jgi:hypothetical protein